MQWIPNDENKRRDEAFADFIGGVAYEEDRGWSKEVWDAAWNTTPPYTYPPKREWVGLTDEERHEIREWQKIQEELGPVWAPMMLYLYLAIEAKLREKNNG